MVVSPNRATLGGPTNFAGGALMEERRSSGAVRLPESLRKALEIDPNHVDRYFQHLEFCGFLQIRNVFFDKSVIDVDCFMDFSCFFMMFLQRNMHMVLSIIITFIITGYLGVG